MKRLGMVLLLIVAQAAVAEEATPVAAFETFLSTLDKDDPASISTAIGYYTEHLADASQQERDDAGILFFDYAAQVAAVQNGVIDKAMETGAEETVAAEIRPGCAANGLVLHGCESAYVEIADAARTGLFRKVGQHMSPVQAAYFELGQEGLYCEGFLSRFRDVPARLAATDAYIKTFPDSPYRDKVEQQQRKLLGDFLTGGRRLGDNLFWDGKAAPETLEVYRKYVADHPGTSCAEVVGRYLAVLEESGFAFSREVYDFIASYAEGCGHSYAVMNAYFTPGNRKALDELEQMESKGTLLNTAPIAAFGTFLSTLNEFEGGTFGSAPVTQSRQVYPACASIATDHHDGESGSLVSTACITCFTILGWRSFPAWNGSTIRAVPRP